MAGAMRRNVAALCACVVASCATVDDGPSNGGLDWRHPLNGREAAAADLANCTLAWLDSPMALVTQRAVGAAGGLVSRLIAEKRLATARRDYVGACMTALGYRRSLAEDDATVGDPAVGVAPARLTDAVDESTGTRLLFVELPVDGRKDWDLGLGFWCADQAVFAMLVAPGIWHRADSVVKIQFDDKPPAAQWFNRTTDRDRVLEDAPAGTGGVVLRNGPELLGRAIRGSRLLVQVDEHAVLQFDLYAARQVFVDFHARCSVHPPPNDEEGSTST